MDFQKHSIKGVLENCSFEDLTKIHQKCFPKDFMKFLIGAQRRIWNPVKHFCEKVNGF